MVDQARAKCPNNTYLLKNTHVLENVRNKTLLTTLQKKEKIYEEKFV
jgi:hypothetical protein